ncbi:NADH dehydrogenase, FAD-containing subunit [Rivularia sp. PCC 7116]|uniref:NAD(P)/FAD-dependent oxidoreductase n=1 Tax=Rivularia sp. PCC 7116 TaxID=373994 RepID=UPI00029F4DEE|nr:NAD(P)/FAD-dependent oxidoreductase [Rivularia sp. PCC 7116]AFY57973.1 NADH dehydrogenase, FAD-containing subunit [Rivularia sp. PCC 7116]
MTSQKPRVVIIGAGFAGVEVAKKLGKYGVNVLLIDRHNYHTFVPMLYQVATAVLYPHQIIYPLRRLLRNLPTVNFLQADVRKVDFDNQIVCADNVAIDYNYLVIATGSQSQFLGVTGAPENSFPMRTLTDAIAIRNQVLSRFEQATKVTNKDEQTRLLTFVIVGGGATGIELAGSLNELIQSALKKDYPTLNPDSARVILIQSGDRLFPSYPQKLGKYTEKWLLHHGIKVHLNSKVSKVTPEAVYLEDNTVIFTDTVIWTAGVLAATPETKQSVKTAAKEKVIVEQTLQLCGHKNIYGVGDVSYVDTQEEFNGVAQEAIQQGKTAADNILLQMRGESPKSFNYFNKGRLAIIAKHAGVGKIGKFPIKGFIAWFLWLEVHLLYLPGIRNRLGVLFNWLKYYFFSEGASRIIISTGKSEKLPVSSEQ